MGRSIPVTLGRFTFKSKAAAKTALRDIRNAHKDRESILGEDDIEILLGVVAAHPQAAEKIGPGIIGFFAAKAPEYESRCFYLQRVDGSETDFSWNEAFTPTTPIKRLRTACREAIAEQKLAFKDLAWPKHDAITRACPITHKHFSRAVAHVDHQPPKTLVALVDEWLTSGSKTVDDISIHHTGDLRAIDSFVDSAQLASWQAFHATNAVLRLVSAQGNLQQGSRLLELIEPVSPAPSNERCH